MSLVTDIGMKQQPGRRLVEKFWSQTVIDGDCVVWSGSKAGKYGSFYEGSYRRGYAHRWILAQIVGALPAGTVVMHSCDRPLCVAPQHLSVGTHSMNHLDAFAKGRKHRRGSVSVGDRFERWTVISFTRTVPRRGTFWRCRCDCGIEREVHGRLLRIGKSRSCGCLMREINSRRTRERRAGGGSRLS